MDKTAEKYTAISGLILLALCILYGASTGMKAEKSEQDPYN